LASRVEGQRPARSPMWCRGELGHAVWLAIAIWRPCFVFSHFPVRQLWLSSSRSQRAEPHRTRPPLQRTRPDAAVATDAADAALQKDTGLGGCLCEPPNFSKNPAGCPVALGVQMVLGKPCSTPGLVCSYANDPPCNCGIDVQCRVDPRADAGADDGGDGGASLVWQTGK
jgi:hypothetical protein